MGIAYSWKKFCDSSSYGQFILNKLLLENDRRWQKKNWTHGRDLITIGFKPKITGCYLELYIGNIRSRYKWTTHSEMMYKRPKVFRERRAVYLRKNFAYEELSDSTRGVYYIMWHQIWICNIMHCCLVDIYDFSVP